MVSDSCKKRFGKIMLEQMELLEQVEIAPNIFSMILKGQMVAQMQAGQFLHIRVPDDSKLLRRPISIAEIDRDNLTCCIIYRIEGGGTAIFSQLPVVFFLDVMGPLFGNPTPRVVENASWYAQCHWPTKSRC